MGHDMTFAGTAARLKASIAWLRDGKPTHIGGIGIADMVAMLPVVEAAVHCAHCDGREVSLERCCHNSACDRYARNETIFESWKDAAAQVDKSPDPQGTQVDETADLQDESKVTVAECIAQLDTWNGRLEAAIDRQAHQQLGQHPNDDGPLEHLP
jgi:hypothetical protein